MADSNNESRGHDAIRDLSAKEQDRFLLIAKWRSAYRSSTASSPATRLISAREEKRKTINGGDLLRVIGFEEYVEPLKLPTLDKE
ncbi:hypothetical protein L1987_80408 [Smallanthus sonchifolius]|uniref:Uncharacterized protein n=1 Tax=Smallanthus sonchifolius TaxID=185202 RepID=A0ACB8YP58_9ASTR|nr:hypothetical protein L1987_80408 [Smallanthus sonchifolius]